MRDRAEADLLERAKAVLASNWCGSYTKPAPRLYPHQWNWDSGFVAIGYAHYAPEKARSELEHLFRAQWRNGMLPHIQFNPESEGYFPGPDLWRTDLSPDLPPGIQTSGISNPPVHAFAALRVHEVRGDEATKEWLRALFPGIVASHRYFYARRDPGGEGLAYIRHPWEAGTDNSPAYDGALSRIDLTGVTLPSYERVDLKIISQAQRPTQRDYDRYVLLIELYKRTGYDDAALSAECPFLVQDVLLNSILCRSNEALLEIAEILGEDSGEIREWEAQTRRALDAKLWDDETGLYTSFDLRAGRSLPAGSVSGFIPLFAGVPDAARARRVVERLDSPGFAGRSGETYRVPSYDLEAMDFDSAKYWRGPVWLNMDWMIYRGLRRYGFDEAAAKVRSDMVELVSRHGFHEYFGPFRRPERGSSGGLGSPGFSWTAALSIDLLRGPDGR